MNNSFFYHYMASDISRSYEFHQCYNLLLQKADEIFGPWPPAQELKESRVRPNDEECWFTNNRDKVGTQAGWNFFTYTELLENFAAWQYFYNSLKYKIDRWAFSPNWVPITPDYACFIDVGHPNWPVYKVTSYREWHWAQEVITLSIRMLNKPIAEVNTYFKVIHGMSDPYPSQANNDYYEAILKYNYEVRELNILNEATDHEWEILEYPSWKYAAIEHANLNDLFRIPANTPIKVLSLSYRTGILGSPMHSNFDGIDTLYKLKIYLYIYGSLDVNGLTLELSNKTIIRLSCDVKTEFIGCKLSPLPKWGMLVEPIDSVVLKHYRL